MTRYAVLATSSDLGLIQVVTNAMTACKIQKAQGGALTGALKNSSLLAWIQEQNPNRTCPINSLATHALTFDAAQDFERAVDNFILSCAGYSVATYVLGVGDRHSDNVRIRSARGLYNSTDCATDHGRSLRTLLPHRFRTLFGKFQVLWSAQSGQSSVCIPAWYVTDTNMITRTNHMALQSSQQ